MLEKSFVNFSSSQLHFLKRCHSSFSSLTYPDLSQAEVEFVERQIQIVTYPPCLSEKPPLDHVTIFPPRSRKFLPPIEDFIQKHYGSFRIRRNSRDRYIRNLYNLSMPILERTLDAMKWANVTQEDLKNEPDLILSNAYEIARLGRISKEAEISGITKTSQFFQYQNLNGKKALQHIRKILESMNKLGFTKEAEAMTKINFAKYNELKFHMIEAEFIRKFIEIQKINQPESDEIVERKSGRIQSFSDLEIPENRKVTIYTPTAQEMARIMYLWKSVMPSEYIFDVRSLNTLDPLESLIIIHSLLQGLEIDLKSIDPGDLWNFLVNSTQTWPVGTQIYLLKEIGLDLAEIKQYLFSSKNPKLSNKSLRISNPNYIPEMRNQLFNIRQNNPNQSIVGDMNQLLQFDFKHEKDTVDEFESEDEVLLN